VGLLGKLGKAGVAKKVVDEARKPQNQRRIKELVSSISSRRNGSRG
jgi:hypothetical protein